MTKQMSLAQLALMAVATPITGQLRQQMLQALADEYRGKAGTKFDFGATYIHPYHIEQTGLDRVRAIPTTGTALELGINTLNAVGIKTEPSLGSFMDTFDLNKDDMHVLICHCEGSIQDGNTMAERFGKLAGKLADAEA